MMSPLSCHVFFAEKPTCRYNLDDHDGMLFSGCPDCSVLLALMFSDIVSTKSLGLKRNNAKDVSLSDASDYPVFNRNKQSFRRGAVLGRSPIISGHASGASNHVSDR